MRSPLLTSREDPDNSGIACHMRKCWGRTKNLRRCGRIAAWTFFCPDHIWQPITLLILILLLVILFISGIFSHMTDQYGQTENTLQDSVDDIIKKQYHKLMKKYPEGYVLFIVNNRRDIVIPENSNFYNHERFDLNWNTARVAKLDRKEIVLRLPNILDKENNVELVDVDSASKRKVGILGKPFRILGFIITTELLVTNNEGVICLIGFRRANQ
jgi:hypothetical protein